MNIAGILGNSDIIDPVWRAEDDYVPITLEKLSFHLKIQTQIALITLIDRKKYKSCNWYSTNEFEGWLW